MKNKFDLALYYFDECPFCQKVIAVINELEVPVAYNNIKKGPEHLEKLLQDRGAKTVPVLYIDGLPMAESGDIINWLRKNFS